MGRAYESGRHPALAAVADDRGGAMAPERLQVCGTPHVAQAVALIAAARRDLAKPER
jgi:hypothetical protein